MSDFTIADDLNLYDSEVQKCFEILTKLTYKYARRPATFENLNSLSSEAMDQFERIGLIATVGIYDEIGKPKLPPEITIHGRVTPKEFDPDKQQYEVKKEVAVEEAVSKFLKQGGTTDERAAAIDAEITDVEKQVEE